VKAVEKLSGNVFRCEIVAANKCKNPVDEGFLKKKWVTKQKLNALQYRGGTWGDKQGLLRRGLGSSTPKPQSGDGATCAADECGCRTCDGEGWSSTRGRCARGSVTDSREASACKPQSGDGATCSADECGCKACDGEGWSTTRGRCAGGSVTDSREASACKEPEPQRSSAPEPQSGDGATCAADECGCKACDGEGWSTTRGQCASGSVTDSREARACQGQTSDRTHGPGGGAAGSCSDQLGVHYEASSACVLMRNHEALLVWVPYGSSPGWDLPGGMKKKRGVCLRDG